MNITCNLHSDNLFAVTLVLGSIFSVMEMWRKVLNCLSNSTRARTSTVGGLDKFTGILRIGGLGLDFSFKLVYFLVLFLDKFCMTVCLYDGRCLRYDRR